MTFNVFKLQNLLNEDKEEAEIQTEPPKADGMQEENIMEAPKISHDHPVVEKEKVEDAKKTTEIEVRILKIVYRMVCYCYIGIQYLSGNMPT